MFAFSADRHEQTLFWHQIRGYGDVTDLALLEDTRA
jgi:hypothetical protein